MNYGKLQDESEPIMRALKKSILWFGVFSIVCAQIAPIIKAKIMVL